MKNDFPEFPKFVYVVIALQALFTVSILGFGGWVIVKLLQHFGVI